MAELKPCPFCGGMAEIVTVTRHIQRNLVVARCTRCGASTKTFAEAKKDNAAEAWNLRAGE